MLTKKIRWTRSQSQSSKILQMISQFYISFKSVLILKKIEIQLCLDYKIIYLFNMAHKKSKFYNSQDFSMATNQQSHTIPIPAYNQKSSDFVSNQSPFNTILKLAIKQKMFGNIITSLRTDQSEKLNLIKVRPSAKKNYQQISTSRYQSMIKTPKTNQRQSNQFSEGDQKRKFKSEKPLQRRMINISNHLQSFISQVDISNTKTETKQKQQNIKPHKFEILPQLKHLRTIKIKTEQNDVKQQKWLKISKNGKLKQNLLQKIFLQHFNERIYKYFVRFFEPPFNHDYKQYNQFIKSLLDLSQKFKKFILFQILDQDEDGIISQNDLFSLYKESAFANNNALFQKEIYKLSHIIVNKNYNIYKTQTIQQYQSTDHSITLSKFLKMLSKLNKPALKLQIKKYTSYPQSFQATEHNQEIRQNKMQIEQMFQHLSKGMHQKTGKEGLSFENYNEVIQNELFSEILNKIC